MIEDSGRTPAVAVGYRIPAQAMSTLGLGDGMSAPDDMHEPAPREGRLGRCRAINIGFTRGEAAG